MKIIRLAIRTLMRFPLYTVINITGLALSLACTLIIIRYIHQEVTVDHFCKDLDRTYLLTSEYHNRPKRLGGNSNPNRDRAFIDPLDDPAIELSSQYILNSEDFLIINEQRYNINTIITDSAFLQIINYPLLAGVSTLESPTDAILTKQLAKRLFGKENPLGKTFKHSTGQILTVAGIIDTPSTKASMVFDMLISINLQRIWSFMDYSIARIAPGTDINRLNQKNSKYMELTFNNGVPMRYQFFPLKEFYFDHTIDTYGDIFQRGNKENISILSIVAILLLIIGLFNFINIYTVVTLKRAREFGVKKVYGAAKRQIFIQIYVENLFMTFIAVFFAWLLIEVTSKFVESHLSIPIQSDICFNSLLSAAILIILPLITTLYPYLKYNYASPITSLRSVNVGGQSIVSRVLFLSIQYIITFCLIVMATFFVKQLYFMLDADLGYRTKDIITCKFMHEISYYNLSDEERKKSIQQEDYILQVIEQKMDASPLFSEWCYGEVPSEFPLKTPFKTDNENQYTQIACKYMTPKYMKIFNFQLKEGRLWDSSIDQFTQYKVIINETAQKLFGITDITKDKLQPENRLWHNYQKRGMDTNPPYEIVGVIKDFKTGHLSKATAPLAICFDKDSKSWGDNLIAAIVPGKREEAITFLKNLYEELIGKGDFEYTFLENEIADMYKEDKQIANIYVTFAIIAILISCLGLFGLSLFDIQQRYREIALRKVNGAKIKEIIPLLLRKYGIILGICFLIATPVSYLIIQKYLEGFANKSPVSWWLFAMAALITAFVSFATLIWQINKAARINPAAVLKGE